MSRGASQIRAREAKMNYKAIVTAALPKAEAVNLREVYDFLQGAKRLAERKVSELEIENSNRARVQRDELYNLLPDVLKQYVSGRDRDTPDPFPISQEMEKILNVFDAQIERINADYYRKYTVLRQRRDAIVAEIEQAAADCHLLASTNYTMPPDWPLKAAREELAYSMATAQEREWLDDNIYVRGTIFDFTGDIPEGLQ